jgi:hypothetical protein
MLLQNFSKTFFFWLKRYQMYTLVLLIPRKGFFFLTSKCKFTFLSFFSYDSSLWKLLGHSISFLNTSTLNWIFSSHRGLSNFFQISGISNKITVFKGSFIFRCGNSNKTIVFPFENVSWQLSKKTSLTICSRQPHLVSLLFHQWRKLLINSKYKKKGLFIKGSTSLLKVSKSAKS